MRNPFSRHARSMASDPRRAAAVFEFRAAKVTRSAAVAL
jgi:hypothetical protein